MNQTPDFLGGGMYNASGYNVDPNKFNNPLGAAAAGPGISEVQNYLGNTTGQVGVSPYTTAAGAGLGSLASRYSALANGQGPSAATVAAQQAGASNLANTESMLGSARGAGNPAAAQQAARNALNLGGQQIAGNVIAGRTNEELGALGGLGSTYGQLGGIGQNVQNVGFGNQGNTLAANTNYLGALTGIAGQQQQGQQSAQQLAEQAALQQQQLQQGAFYNTAGNNNKIFGQALGAGAQAAGSLFGV